MATQGLVSIGVVSSICAIEFDKIMKHLLDCSYVLDSHTLVEMHTISRLLSLWLTTLRKDKLIIVKGGMSLTELSVIGLTSLGSDMVASSLHHET